MNNKLKSNFDKFTNKNAAYLITFLAVIYSVFWLFPKYFFQACYAALLMELKNRHYDNRHRPIQQNQDTNEEN